MSDERRCLELYKRIRLLIWIVILGLWFSGLTAFFLETELRFAAQVYGLQAFEREEEFSGFPYWLIRIRNGLSHTNSQYPFIAYGTDWLAFAHLSLAVLFLGILRDPVRNLWVLTFGLIACISIFPLAFICGELRGIPLYWKLTDCSFGVGGFVPLWYARKYCLELEHNKE